MGYRNYNVANGFVVDKLGNGDFTTIAAALTASVSGDTIFIRPGTYAENPTLKAGVNLTAFDCDALTPNVTIQGTTTLSTAGTVSISGINFTAPSSNSIVVSGSVASILNLKDCFISSEDVAAISFTSSSSSAAINIDHCLGNLIASSELFVSSSPGTLTINNSNFTNSFGATPSSSTSSGIVNIYNSNFSNSFSTSSTGIINFYNANINVSSLNQIAFTTVGTGSSTLINSYVLAGTASTISVGSGTTVTIANSSISSSNTNAITGAGTLNYSGLTFTGTSSLINTTTQTGGTLVGGKFQAPSAGFLGERITSGFIGPSGIGNATTSTLTSITLTPGVWDLSGMGWATSSGGSFSTFQVGIGTTVSSYTGVNFGDAGFQINNGTTMSVCSGSIPSYRQVITTNTTYYLTFLLTGGTGTLTVQGRLSAVRVG